MRSQRTLLFLLSTIAPACALQDDVGAPADRSHPAFGTTTQALHEEEAAPALFFSAQQGTLHSPDGDRSLWGVGGIPGLEVQDALLADLNLDGQDELVALTSSGFVRTFTQSGRTDVLWFRTHVHSIRA